MAAGRRQPGYHRFARKVRMVGAKLPNDLLILFHFGRAGTIDDDPAGPQETANVCEDHELPSLLLHEHGIVFLPFGFGMAAEDAEPTTRGIHENAIEWFRAE